MQTMEWQNVRVALKQIRITQLSLGKVQPVITKSTAATMLAQVIQFV